MDRATPDCVELPGATRAATAARRRPDPLTLTLTTTPPQQKELEAALELLELQQQLAADLGYDSVEELESAMEEIEEEEGGLEVGLRSPLLTPPASPRLASPRLVPVVQFGGVDCKLCPQFP